MSFPRLPSLLLLLPLLSLFAGPAASAQSAGDGEWDRQGVRYLDLRMGSLEKLAQRTDRQQQRLLRRLARREKRFAARLRQKDSAAYARYRSQGVSFDSLSKLDSSAVIRLAGRMRTTGGQSVDSLRAIAGFLNGTAAGAQQPLESYSGDINALSGSQRYNEAVGELIGRRGNQLSGLGKGTTNMPALTGIQKDIFYTRSRIAAWKKVADDPDAAEARALEYLQGTPGFDGAMLQQSGATGMGGSNSNGPGPAMAGSGATAADLERMGLQTKRQVGAGLQQQFGTAAAGLQQLAGSVGDWQRKATSTVQGVNDVRSGMGGLRNGLRSGGGPGFKVNPMRGLPFWQRLEKHYNFQVQRAGGERPALVQLGGSIGFRHTPKLSYGLGAALEAGLGKDFRHIRISFEGIGLRSYAAWQLGWGMGAYAGYERVWKGTVIGIASETGTQTGSDLPASVHETKYWRESALLGITKQYRMGRNTAGSIQLLYDLWWRDKGLPSPIILRIQATK